MGASPKTVNMHRTPLVPLGLGLLLALNVAPQVNGGRACFHFLWALAAGLVATALLYRARPQGTPLRPLGPWIAALLVCFGLIGGVSGEHAAVHVVTMVCYGLGTAYLLCRWFQTIAATGFRDALTLVLLAFSVSALARLGIAWVMGLSPWVAGVALTLVVLASTACGFLPNGMEPARAADPNRRMPPDGSDATALPVGQRDSATEKSKGRTPARLRAIAIVGLELAAYALVFGILRTDLLGLHATGAMRVPGQLIQAAIPLFLLAGAAFGGDDGRRRAIARATLLVAAGAILASIFFAGAVTQTIALVMYAVRCLISILIFVRLLEVTFRLGAHPVVAYGLGRAWFGVVFCVGLLAYDAVLAHGALESLPNNVVYFCMCVVALLLLTSFSSMPITASEDAAELEGARTGGAAHGDVPGPGKAGLGSTADADTPQNDPATPGKAPTIDERCATVCERYQLGEREEQVLRLTVEGLSKKEMAARLYLSEDTIRYHTKQLYKKLDIHSRQDLMLLLMEGAAS